jgi:hypothetical protein
MAPWHHGTRGDFIKRSAYFAGYTGPVFDFRHVFISCRPYSISNIFTVKPAFVPRDEMPPIIVRLCAEFEK